VVLHLILCVGWQGLFYLIAAGFKFDKVTDLAYGTNFVLNSIITLCFGGTYYVRQIVVTILVDLWGIRLAGFLFYRIVTIGEDKRFDEYRQYPLRFLRFWIFQMIAVFVILLPEVFLNSDSTDDPLNFRDYLGWAMFVIGFVVEVWADQAKFGYRNNTNNKGHWCDSSIWSWSRHPNYFGEVLLWFGLAVSCCSVFHKADWATFVGPTFLLLLLLFVSGIPLLEKSSDNRFWNTPGYQDYKRATSPFIPLPPVLYRSLPKFLKLSCCCEFPLYTYEPEADPVAGEKYENFPSTQ